MPQPVEAMLARWPLLYPETTDADEQDGALAATFEEHRGELGDATVKAALECIRLRRIVRRSTIPTGRLGPRNRGARLPTS